MRISEDLFPSKTNLTGENYFLNIFKIYLNIRNCPEDKQQMEKYLFMKFYSTWWEQWEPMAFVAQTGLLQIAQRDRILLHLKEQAELSRISCNCRPEYEPSSSPATIQRL